MQLLYNFSVEIVKTKTQKKSGTSPLKILKFCLNYVNRLLAFQKTAIALLKAIVFTLNLVSTVFLIINVFIFYF